MNTQRLRYALLAVPFIAVSALTLAADRSRPDAGVIDPTCSSSLPCIEYDNNSTGPGVRGVSLKGNGLAGWTDFNSTSAANGKAGVGGYDKSTSGVFDSGVIGQSIRGTGVAGMSTSGAGVQGTGGIGVKGIGVGTTGTGVEADSSGGNAILARSTAGGALFYGIGVSNPTFVVDAYGNITTTGGANVYSTVYVSGPSYGVSAAVTGTDPYGAGVVSVTENPQSWLFRGYSDFHGAYTFEVADDGTVFAKGYGSLSAVRTLQKTSTGRSVATYAPQVSQPTLEDFGEAELVNGVANVALEPRFADAIDRTAGYLVTVTPEGDCRGLYVALRSRVGFTVRELQGGRSSIAFAYRISAKPFGDSSVRLPTASMPRGFTPNTERPPQPPLLRRPMTYSERR